MRKYPPTSEKLSEQSVQVLEYLQDETDRGCALVSAAFLDDVLHRMLLASLREGNTTRNLLDQELSTFDARAKSAYVLGHIDKRQYQNLDIIRSVRNEFAHQYDKIDFETSKIAKLCRSLKPIWSPPPPDGGYKERFLFTLNVVELMNDMQLTTLSFDAPQDSKTLDKYRRKGPPIGKE